jgi:hypothetical protein
MGKKRKVFVCRKCKNSDCVARVVKKSEAKLVLVGCQKICAGPVAGLSVAGRMEWFSRVDTPKRLAGLRMLAERRRKRPVPALESRRLSKRSGRPPR